jgi:GNAT superfamily N-acetyltransferase
VEVRQTRTSDWAELQRTRLAALGDTPEAFASTLADDAALADEVWQRWATPSENQSNFAAVQGTTWLGMCAVLGDHGGESAQLVAMWVHPSHRGRGIAATLIEAATGWCRERDIPTLGVWVNEVNTTAIRVYQRAGFMPSGRRQPLRNHPGHFEIAMEHSLRSGPAGSGQ